MPGGGEVGERQEGGKVTENKRCREVGRWRRGRKEERLQKIKDARRWGVEEGQKGGKVTESCEMPGGGEVEEGQK
ncbi:hypothetical protein PoB_005859100 [Plakobranchus ocellatus]|uniref:Uncharacterized protein n=1 Tax=Plakobranchus ocellatus TaxID=259542 RepID=A0AAV4CKJ4_9GAST|nr:hypothetical protein PoB_005859100 [Plakobranchus ocellatus]